jgi:hypothetical protein
MSGKKLITESDVLAMMRGEVIRLDSRTIITPAALDTAHRRGVLVTRGEEGTGSSSSSSCTGGSQECLWHSVLATDGTYVVRVAGGRATIDQLTDRGPVRFGAETVEEHHA